MSLRLSPLRHGCTRVAADERGAIALLGLFMAVLLAAAVHYVAGIGEAVLYRERMQDAADTAAFSAAVLHARGMNLIALVNMVMAALLAILVALKLVETVVSIAVVLITLASIFGAPGLSAAIPGLARLRGGVQEAHDGLRPAIHAMLEALHAANRALRVVMPEESATRAAQVALAYDSSPAEQPIVLPPRPTLPTRDGSFPELCDQAGDPVGDLAGFVISGFVPGAIADGVGDAVSELARARASWYCGDGDAPAAGVTHTVHHPLLPSVQACEAMRPEQPDYTEDRHREVCAQADRDKRAAKPDRRSGQCAGECEPALYELRAALARTACGPRRGDDPLRGFEWQERRFERSYVWSRGRWHVRSEGRAQLRYRRSDVRPCGHAAAVVAREWNRELRDADGAGSLPLCTNARPPRGPGLNEGQTRSLEHVEVVHVFGCTERVRRSYAVDAGEHPRVGAGDPAGQRGKVPQRVLDAARLGGDHFQVRAVVLGEAPPNAERRAIAAARWNNAQDARLLGAADAGAGRIAFAQAEYFYAVERPGAYAHANLLWNMRWQARLRRFRLPDADASDAELLSADAVVRSLVAACTETLVPGGAPRGGGISCEALANVIDLIVH